MKTKLQELQAEMEEVLRQAGADGQDAPPATQDLLKGIQDAFDGINAGLSALLGLAKGGKGPAAEPDEAPAAPAKPDEGPDEDDAEPDDMGDAPDPDDDEPESAEDALQKALNGEDVVDVGNALLGFAKKVDRMEKCMDLILANQGTQLQWMKYHADQNSQIVGEMAKGVAAAVEGQVTQVSVLAKGMAQVQTAINAGPRGGISLTGSPAGAARRAAPPVPASEGATLTAEQLSFALSKGLATDLQVTLYENRGAFSYEAATNEQILQSVRTAWQADAAAAKPRA